MAASDDADGWGWVCAGGACGCPRKVARRARAGSVGLENEGAVLAPMTRHELERSVGGDVVAQKMFGCGALATFELK